MQGAVESVFVGEIKLSLRQSLVKLGVGFISRDPKLQVLICDLEVVMRPSNKRKCQVGIVIKNLDISSGGVTLNLNEELLLKNKSSSESSSNSDGVIRSQADSVSSKKPSKKQQTLAAFSKYSSMFPERCKHEGVLCLIVVLIDMPRYIYNKKAGIVHQGINQ
ncbi:protein SABRE [Trifolium repens]|nr:protein SABRE [Trifolium repens]